MRSNGGAKALNVLNTQKRGESTCKNNDGCGNTDDSDDGSSHDDRASCDDCASDTSEESDEGCNSTDGNDSESSNEKVDNQDSSERDDNVKEEDGNCSAESSENDSDDNDDSSEDDPSDDDNGRSLASEKGENSKNGNDESLGQKGCTVGPNVPKPEAVGESQIKDHESLKTSTDETINSKRPRDQESCHEAIYVDFVRKPKKIRINETIPGHQIEVALIEYNKNDQISSVISPPGDSSVEKTLILESTESLESHLKDDQHSEGVKSDLPKREEEGGEEEETVEDRSNSSASEQQTTKDCNSERGLSSNKETSSKPEKVSRQLSNGASKTNPKGKSPGEDEKASQPNNASQPRHVKKPVILLSNDSATSDKESLLVGSEDEPNIVSEVKGNAKDRIAKEPRKELKDKLKKKSEDKPKKSPSKEKTKYQLEKSTSESNEGEQIKTAKSSEECSKERVIEIGTSSKPIILVDDALQMGADEQRSLSKTTIQKHVPTALKEGQESKMSKAEEKTPRTSKKDKESKVAQTERSTKEGAVAKGSKTKTKASGQEETQEQKSMHKSDKVNISKIKTKSKSNPNPKSTKPCDCNCSSSVTESSSTCLSDESGDTAKSKNASHPNLKIVGSLANRPPSDSIAKERTPENVGHSATAEVGSKSKPTKGKNTDSSGSSSAGKSEVQPNPDGDSLSDIANKTVAKPPVDSLVSNIPPKNSINAPLEDSERASVTVADNLTSYDFERTVTKRKRGHDKIGSPPSPNVVPKSTAHLFSRTFSQPSASPSCISSKERQSLTATSQPFLPAFLMPTSMTLNSPFDFSTPIFKPEMTFPKEPEEKTLSDEDIEMDAQRNAGCVREKSKKPPTKKQKS
ncbi:hypothetical protein BGZ76_010625 [Entomortierella beljakovae]|nr:hypothetical protein BGZ76_010625 [Entomortierella beljakovae]